MSAPDTTSQLVTCIPGLLLSAVDVPGIDFIYIFIFSVYKWVPVECLQYGAKILHRAEVVWINKSDSQVDDRQPAHNKNPYVF